MAVVGSVQIEERTSDLFQAINIGAEILDLILVLAVDREVDIQ